jgi:hypothetical protein
MDDYDGRGSDTEKESTSPRETIEALAKLFGPLLKLTKDWPPLLAYGALMTVLIIALAVLRVAVPTQLFWLLCAVFGAVLVAFVVTYQRAPSKPPRPGAKPDGTEEGRARPGKLLLYCTSGDFASDQIEIPSEGIYIGRDPRKASLVLRSEQISSVHVRVWPEPGSGRLWVEDLNSRNRTFYREEGAGRRAGTEWIPLKGKILLDKGARFRLASAAEFEIRTGQ